MWVRGLKQILNDGEKRKYMSHPMWVRGLKHFKTSITRHPTKVAPYVGAWIETNSKELAQYQHGRTLCGCVD